MTLSGHDGPVYSVAFKADGSQALSGGRDGVVNLWDLSSAVSVRQFQAHEGPVWAVAFSPDGRFAISSGSDEAVRIWHLETGDKVGPAIEEKFLNEPKPWLESNHPGAQFYKKCAVCHSIVKSGKQRSGPHLSGLFGRASGAVPNYNYSPALRSLGVVWTRDTVRKLFSIGPDKYIPGTKMPVQKVTNSEELDLLIDFLEEITTQDR